MSSGSVLLVTVLLMGYLYWSLAQPTNLIEIRCKVMVPKKDPSECAHGAFINTCSKLDCWQGPGQECGENVAGYIRYGQCAPGLRCCNGRCKGCLNGNCFRESCHPTHAFQLRSDPYMPERHMDPLYRLFDYYNNE
ncbi:uncharacterized protein LOC118505363 [Anopheles stephensi]|uniref:Uncharacterized protein n=1 Tax=Anopheles stephensi TaxID=30069 RepID=A0A182YQW6_ANOST|nr:uncharacterized protein LOC118505363 [Anopheles stephensi]